MIHLIKPDQLLISSLPTRDAITVWIAPKFLDDRIMNIHQLAHEKCIVCECHIVSLRRSLPIQERKSRRVRQYLTSLFPVRIRLACGLFHDLPRLLHVCECNLLVLTRLRVHPHGTEPEPLYQPVVERCSDVLFPAGRGIRALLLGQSVQGSGEPLGDDIEVACTPPRINALAEDARALVEKKRQAETLLRELGAARLREKRQRIPESRPSRLCSLPRGPAMIAALDMILCTQLKVGSACLINSSHDAALKWNCIASSSWLINNALKTAFLPN